jgi:hypothetical protein
MKTTEKDGKHDELSEQAYRRRSLARALARPLAEGPDELADPAVRKHLHNKLEELMLSLERFLLMDESHLLRWSDAMSQTPSLELPGTP